MNEKKSKKGEREKGRKYFSVPSMTFSVLEQTSRCNPSKIAVPNLKPHKTTTSFVLKKKEDFCQFQSTSYFHSKITTKLHIHIHLGRIELDLCLKHCLIAKRKSELEIKHDYREYTFNN